MFHIGSPQDLNLEERFASYDSLTHTVPSVYSEDEPPPRLHIKSTYIAIGMDPRLARAVGDGAQRVANSMAYLHKPVARGRWT